MKAQGKARPSAPASAEPGIAPGLAGETEYRACVENSMAQTLAISLPAAIVASRRAAPSVAELMAATGLGRAALERRVAESERAGLVAYWPERDRATLTPLGAYRLRVRLAGPRWIRAESPDPVERAGRARVATVCEADRLAHNPQVRMDQVPDPSPSAEEELAAFESREAEVEELAARRGNARRRLRPLAPRHITGLGSPWCRGDYLGAWLLGPRPSRPGPDCPGCGGRPLGLAEVCIRCDRTGVDDRQPAEVRARRRRRSKPKRRAAAGPRLARLAELLAAQAAS